MKHTTDDGFDQASSGNFTEAAILAHSGIVGEEDELFMLNPKVSQDFNDFDEKIKILYQFAKTRGKFVSWRNALVNLDFNQTGQIVILPQWLNPEPWKGVVHYCFPNKGIEM